MLGSSAVSGGLGGARVGAPAAALADWADFLLCRSSSSPSAVSGPCSLTDSLLCALLKLGYEDDTRRSISGSGNLGETRFSFTGVRADALSELDTGRGDSRSRSRSLLPARFGKGSLVELDDLCDRCRSREPVRSRSGSFLRRRGLSSSRGEGMSGHGRPGASGLGQFIEGMPCRIDAFGSSANSAVNQSWTGSQRQPHPHGIRRERGDVVAVLQTNRTTQH